ncbi:MAG: antitoxin Xre-like helix-turn-helix domain-containing protein [Opitutales bacterium]|jgi:putative toxin-antitoxin system antitoxin component (TIGR02293 family)
MTEVVSQKLKHPVVLEHKVRNRVGKSRIKGAIHAHATLARRAAAIMGLWTAALADAKEPTVAVLSSPEMTELEMRIVRDGVLPEMFYGVATEAGIPVAELAHALGMNERTIQRKKKAGEPLDSDMSERAFRALKIWTMAKDTLGGVDQAREWLSGSIRSLGGATPLSLLGTSAGERMVVNTLGAIEYGIYL